MKHTKKIQISKEAKEKQKPQDKVKQQLEVSIKKRIVAPDPQKLEINVSQKLDQPSKSPRPDKKAKKEKEPKEVKQTPRKPIKSPVKQLHDSVAKADRERESAKQDINNMAKSLSKQVKKPESRISSTSQMESISGSVAADFMSSRPDSFSASLPRTITSSEWRRLSPDLPPSPDKPRPKSKVTKMEPILMEKSELLPRLPTGGTCSESEIVTTDVKGHESKVSSVSVVFSPKKKSRQSDVLYGEKTLHTVEVTDMELKVKKGYIGTDESEVETVEKTVEQLEVRAKGYPKPEGVKGKQRPSSDKKKQKKSAKVEQS